MYYPNKKIEQEVSIPYPLYQAKKGEYFIGQTPKLIGENQNILAALVNPIDSKVDLYVNAITVTNISPLNLSAEFYLRATLNEGIVSDSVSCTNLDIIPEPIPEGEIKYLTTATEPPQDGVNIFSRIVSSYSTLVIDGGQIIISPGQSLIVYLGGFLPLEFDNVIVAFGWWEETIYEYPCCHC